MFRRFLDPFYFGGLLFDGEGGGGGSGDGGQGDGGNGGEGQGQGSGEGQGEGQRQERTFTQADLDRIVQDRLAKEKGKYADYDDLKTKAQKLEEIEQANASEAEKAAKRAEQAEAKVSAATDKLRRANLLAALAEKELTGAKGKAAAKLLDTVEFGDDDEPTNLDDAITAAKAEYGEDVFKAAPNGRPAGDGDGGKGGSTLTRDEIKRIARDDPDRFNQLFEEGKIPAEALGGKQ